ncbi:MAG: NmrA/HSCARG family protein [Microthrixaceae bacterium]
MSPAGTRTVAVLGATGAQGGGVVRALQTRGRFTVRALTRNPDAAVGLGDEVAAADPSRPETLTAAFAGAHGVFANTNSFGGPDVDEVAQGRAIIEAAREAGVTHFVWSTLPDVESISDGEFDVPHFTNKAKVEDFASAAGFESVTFTAPPFYYQNLLGPMYVAAPGPDGTPTWSQPMSPDSRTIHMGDINEYGNLVAGAFEQPSTAGQGQHLSFAGDLLSWNDIIDTLRRQGHDIAYTRMPDDIWDDMFDGADAIRRMFNYFEAHTYFGPNAGIDTTAAARVTTAPFTTFSDWSKTNMPVST